MDHSLRITSITVVYFVLILSLSSMVCLKLQSMEETLYLSRKILVNEETGLVDGGLVVDGEGRIKKVLETSEEVKNYKSDNYLINVIDFGDKILMPGLIDTHVHVNEPGRKDWEGFVTATKAAAAGGFTTIADMPLNSIPPTISVENLKTKMNAARGKIFVDLAFWGGLVPDNMENLRDLIENGVVGFKCFLAPSGVPEFPYVTKEEVEKAVKLLEGTGTVLAFHAELESAGTSSNIDNSHPEKYQTYLSTKPPSMEIEAVRLIAKLALTHNVKLHVVHLSAADALHTIQECKENGGNLTVETCHHYLFIASEDIPDYHTEFKCSPPIRERTNQEKLWRAVIENQIDQIVSDHSPSPANLKYLEPGQSDRGNFLKAWGGIGSNQFGLSLFWTNALKHKLGVQNMYKLMSLNPSKLLGIDDRKGKFEEGYDADFCVWDPNEEFVITPEIIEFKNKITPYMNKTLRGRVHATYVRGNNVFQIFKDFDQPKGIFTLRK